MSLARRLVLGFLAAILAATPTLACAAFCPDKAASVSADKDSAPGGGAMPEMGEDCPDRLNAAPPPADDACDGCYDCATAAQLEKPAPIAAAAIVVDAPVLILADAPFTDHRKVSGYGLYRPTPPAIGPPAAATPVALGNILRL